MSNSMKAWNDAIPPINLYNYYLTRKEPVLKLFSKSNCPACLKTEALLNSYNIPYIVSKIDEDPLAKDFILSQGHRQIPQLYVGDKLFVQGGYLGLVKMSEREIKELLYGEL